MTEGDRTGQDTVLWARELAFLDIIKIIYSDHQPPKAAKISDPDNSEKLSHKLKLNQ